MYETLADLKAAYDRGEITEPLTIDNDATYVYVGNDDDPSSWRKVFDLDPYDLLRAALDLLGIPHEDC